MWYLWIFGDNVEDRVGHGRFIVFYLLCGIAAALGQVAVDPNSTLPTIGASGAIAGVMGAYFVLYPHSRVLTLIPLDLHLQIVELPAIVLLGFWFLMQLFSAGTIAMTTSTQRRRRRVRGARRRLRGGHGRRVRVQEARSSIRGIGRLTRLTQSLGTPVRCDVSDAATTSRGSAARCARSRRSSFSSSASYWSGGVDSFRAFSSSSCVSSSARRRISAGERGVGRQRERRVRLEIGDARDRAVGAGVLRLAADAGAGVVEQRPLGRQLPLLLEPLPHAGARVGERFPHRHAAVLIEVGGRIVERLDEELREHGLELLRRRIGRGQHDAALGRRACAGTESWRRSC